MSISIPTTKPPPQTSPQASLPDEADKLTKSQAAKKRERGVKQANNVNKRREETTGNAPKKAKTHTPRRPATKRVRKNDLLDDSSTPSTNAILPSPPGSPKSTPTTAVPMKTQPNRHTGRQHAGAYTREEVHALQTYINAKISPEWDTIAQHVGKTTGVYRHKDNLRTFYGTIVLRQMYDCFPDKNGQGGDLIVVDVKEGDKEAEGKVGKGRVCGGCGAKLVEGLPEGKHDGEQEEVKGDDGIQSIEEGKHEKNHTRRRLSETWSMHCRSRSTE